MRRQKGRLMWCCIRSTCQLTAMISCVWRVSSGVCRSSRRSWKLPGTSA
ncbi:hypothetical protein cypCar_00050291 [Cyprinus carpio]|nr:hypothetical protein cypCar_00050291 [Cyprinus carpio]